MGWFKTAEEKEQIRLKKAKEQQDKEEQKIMQNIKAKKEQMDKIKEEITTMADKLHLEQGRLVPKKVQSSIEPQAPISKPQPLMDIPPLPSQATPTQDMQAQAMRLAQLQQLQEQQNIQALQQAQLQQAQQAQLQQVQQAQYEEQLYQQQMQQQLMQQKAVVNIVLMNGMKIAVNLAAAELQAFIVRLNTAIENEILFALENQQIHGRYIAYYEFGVQ